MAHDSGSDTLAGWIGTPDEGRAAEAPTRIAGRYTVEAQLGVGGMGAVYRVRDHELDEAVALKMLRADLVGRPGLAARFRQEVKLARRVTHPNVVRTFDLGEFVGEDGVPRLFLTMELVEGRSLARLLSEDGPCSVGRAAPLVAGICAGLQAAHDASVLHRDLKPDNVLVTAEGRAVLTDFGIARAAAEEGPPSPLGGVVGTPAYMAPEQAVPGATIDHRADIYALGALLFELLTGTRARPARGADPTEVPDPRTVRPEVPEAIAAVVRRCLAPRPDDRFPTVRAVATAWEAARASQRAVPSLAPPTSIEAPHEGAGTLAVLPFTAAAPEDRELALGFAEELSDAFSMTRGLRVRPLGALRGLADSLDARELGRRLRVATVVHGTVRRTEGGFRVTVRCLAVDDGFQVGAWRFASADPVSVADDAAASVARALAVELSVPQRHSANPEATELYLRGKHALRANWFRPDGALRLLEDAHARAPEDASILAEYATAMARAASFGRERLGELNERARTLAERAVALGPERAEGWFALAVSHTTGNRLPAAAAACKAALTRSPGHLGAQELLASLLLEVGEINEAMSRFRSVLAADPASRVASDLARAHALRGDWDRVVACLEPLAAVPTLAWARLALWNRDLPPAPPLPPPPPDAQGSALLPWVAQAVLGRVRDGTVTEAELRATGDVGVIHETGRLLTARLQVAVEVAAALRRDADVAMLLDRAVEAGLVDLTWLDRCPLLAPYRTHPAFLAARRAVAPRAEAVLAAAR